MEENPSEGRYLYLKRTDGSGVQKRRGIYTFMDIRKYCMEEQNTLWDETRRLVNPHEVYVDLSDRLYRMKTDLLNQMHPGD